MSKKPEATFPNSLNDFYKTNGTVHVVMPGGPSLTRQEFAAECDINSIMKRYESVGGGPGGLPRHSDVPPFYADFATMPTSLLDYMNLMRDAETAFMMLPATVRRFFGNDPTEFVAFAGDPANLKQMQDWGLAPVPVPEAPSPGAGTPAPGEGPGGAIAPPGSLSPARPAAAPAGATQGST